MFALDPELLHSTGLDRNTEQDSDEWRCSQPEERISQKPSLFFLSLHILFLDQDFWI